MIVDLTPLPARSVVLSVVLGSPPGGVPAAGLVRVAQHVGVSAATARVALSRAVTAGDLRREHDAYVLGERLERRRRQRAAAARVVAGPWDGAWEVAVVVVVGRSGPDRAALRGRLAAARLAELREGVWTRPANLVRTRPYVDDPVLRTFRGQPDRDPADLAHALWDLAGWADRARGLRELLGSATPPARRLAVAAHVVNHLEVDPLLPASLLPDDWPAPELRSAYAGYQEQLQQLALARG